MESKIHPLELIEIAPILLDATRFPKCIGQAVFSKQSSCRNEVGIFKLKGVFIQNIHYSNRYNIHQSSNL